MAVDLITLPLRLLCDDAPAASHLRGTRSCKCTSLRFVICHCEPGAHWNLVSFYTSPSITLTFPFLTWGIVQQCLWLLRYRDHMSSCSIVCHGRRSSTWAQFHDDPDHMCPCDQCFFGNGQIFGPWRIVAASQNVHSVLRRKFRCSLGAQIRGVWFANLPWLESTSIESCFVFANNIVSNRNEYKLGIPSFTESERT